MNNKVIIFGTNDFAELAHFYLTNDSEFEVVAFSVNSEFMKGIKDEFCSLPVVSFENIEENYSPDDFYFFAPMAPTRMNRNREEIYNQIKLKGYNFISYVSSKAIILNKTIGENCFILENNVIQPFTKIGNNVVIWSGNHIGHHTIIEDHVMFTSHVVMSGNCKVENYCLFGVNSTIRDNILIREGTFLTMSSSLISDSEPWGYYKGNPAKKGKISTKILK